MAADIQTTVENARAQYHYPPIRSAILPSEADDLQMRLADRLYRHGHQHALEVIADLGRVFDAEDREPAIEALGRLLIHASLLAGRERMAIAPIIALGRELTRDSQVSSELPLRPAAMLAWAALGRSHDDAAIARGLAMAIAKAIDDCEIVHELKIDPLELFKIAAREVLDGKPTTVVTAPAVQPSQPDKAAQRALAWAELRKASGELVATVPLEPSIIADDPTEATTPEQRANVERWFKTPHEVLTGKVRWARIVDDKGHARSQIPFAAGGGRIAFSPAATSFRAMRVELLDEQERTLIKISLGAGGIGRHVSEGETVEFGPLDISVT